MPSPNKRPTSRAKLKRRNLAQQERYQNALNKVEELFEKRKITTIELNSQLKHFEKVKDKLTKNNRTILLRKIGMLKMRLARIKISIDIAIKHQICYENHVFMYHI